jgi:protein-tyrosine-phosphatase
MRSAAGPYGVQVESAGTHDFRVGEGAHPEMSTAAERRGYSLRDHCVRQVSDRLMDSADRVIALDGTVHADLVATFPEHAGKIRAWDVGDPYGGTPADYAKTIEVLEDLIGGYVAAELLEDRRS